MSIAIIGSVQISEKYLDEIFGKENFKNEIIWHYELGMKAKSKKFHYRHDTLLYYAKNIKNSIYNEIRIKRDTPVKLPKIKFNSTLKESYSHERQPRKSYLH